MSPFISICIPSYKRTGYLRRLLDSIAIQGYEQYEVVVSDDTPGNEVAELCSAYSDKITLRYYHNHKALGTPENWNEAIRHAKGLWIKIMHDDDWFAENDSLENFAAAIESNPAINFFFSAYNNVYEQEKNRVQTVQLGKSDELKLKKTPLRLFQKNYIGNPSCTLFRKNENLLFDNRFKWVVDFEFYMRYLRSGDNEFCYIDKPLINASLNSSQVTSTVFRDPKIEIPENHLLLEKEGPSILNNVLVYDYFWRCYRNLGIKDKEEVAENGFKDVIEPVLEKMIRWQRNIPGKLLFVGPISKSLMLLHYILYKGEIPAAK